MSGWPQERHGSSEVCALLQARRRDIHDAYAQMLKAGAGPHYSTRPEEELWETTGRSIVAYLAVLCAGDWGPMEAFVEEIAEKRFPLRFPLSEVQKAFAIFRKIAVPIFTESFQGEQLDRSLGLLDQTVDRAINLFSDKYQNLHLEEIRRTSAELEEAHSRLQGQYEEVAEASRIKSQFFANMSHELRSPMNSVIGYTELLLDGIDGPVNEEQKGSLQRILASSRYLLKLINDVLDLSKIEAGRMEVQAKPFDVGSLVQESLDTVTPLAYRKRIELRTDVPADISAFTADAEKVKQVLINLLSNAVKFTDEGEVVCRVRRDGRGLHFEIRDTGIGISPEDQSRIFQKFFQVETSHVREHKGTGLGLALSRMLVEILGGHLEFQSQLGRGSVFSFTVPDAGLPRADSASISPRGSPPRVLLIEDDPSALILLRKMLEAEGMEVVAARDGAEGVALARSVGPSAITLDLLMPRADGWEVLQRLKADPATRHIPVMIVSCVDRKEEGRRMGADAYAVKPVERESFVRALRELVTPPARERR